MITGVNGFYKYFSTAAFVIIDSEILDSYHIFRRLLSVGKSYSLLRAYKISQYFASGIWKVFRNV